LRSRLSIRYLLEQLADFFDELVELGVNFFKWSGRHVLVEVSGEGDFVADFVFRTIHPEIRQMWGDFGRNVFVDVSAERHVFRVSEVGVWLRVAFRVCDDWGIIVVFREGCHEGS